MTTSRTGNPAPQAGERRSAAVLQRALDQIRSVFVERAIHLRSQQMATAITFMTVSIAEAASLSDGDPAEAATVLVDEACRVLRENVARAAAEIGRPN